MRIARGAPYGAAAHGFGLSVARKVGTEEGAVASLTMIFSGVVTVLLAPAGTSAGLTARRQRLHALHDQVDPRQKILAVVVGAQLPATLRANGNACASRRDQAPARLSRKCARSRPFPGR
jgi:hypothetical protein